MVGARKLATPQEKHGPHSPALNLVFDTVLKNIFDIKMRYLAIAPFALAVANVAATPQTASSAPPKTSNIPKLGGAPIPFGPAPTGCNSYEILIGEHAQHRQNNSI
jgi:hypothetical protein